ncbi:unnamed protein product [Prunus brigantina]
MKRGKSFTLEQDVAICNARLNIFQDPFNVVSKPQYNFWDRIYQNYVELTGDQNVRSQCSVQSRWKSIFGSCKKFHDCLARVEDKQSGLTESNKVLRANMLYFEHEKKRFAFNHCWEILQHKMKDLVPAKSPDPRTKDRDPNIHSSFSSHPLDPNTLVPPESDKDSYYIMESRKSKRPTRRRAEKEAHRRSKVVNTLDSRICDLMEQFTKQLAESDKRKAEVAERKVKVMEEMNERQQREQDDRIMSMDTSNMGPRARAYYEHRKSDIYFKTMGHTADKSNMEDKS